MQKRRRTTPQIPYSGREDKRSRVHKIGQAIPTSDTLPLDVTANLDASDALNESDMVPTDFLPVQKTDPWYTKYGAILAILVTFLTGVFFVWSMNTDIKIMAVEIKNIKDDAKDTKDKVNRFDSLFYDAFKKRLQR